MTAIAQPAQAPPSIDLDHLSWSGIECYRQCPKKFAFRYVEQAAPEFTPSSLAYGTAFHHVFGHVQQARMEGLPVPSEGDLLDAFDMGWQEATADGVPVQFNKSEDMDSIHDLATRMIAAYRCFALDELAGGTIVAIEEAERFRILPDVPPIEMRLDLAEVRDNCLIVSDMKTARNRWNEQKIRDNLPQLVLYAVGLAPLIRDLGVRRVVPKFIVVTKGKKPKVQVLEPKATKDDVQKLKHRIADTWAAVRAGIFMQHEGWQCPMCPYKTRCQEGHAG